jgi:regulator of replication initiation timing
LTSEIERIKILEGKIGHVIEYIGKLTAENDKLKQQLKGPASLTRTSKDTKMKGRPSKARSRRLSIRLISSAYD